MFSVNPYFILIGNFIQLFWSVISATTALKFPTSFKFTISYWPLILWLSAPLTSCKQYLDETWKCLEGHKNSLCSIWAELCACSSPHRFCWLCNSIPISNHSRPLPSRTNFSPRWSSLLIYQNSFLVLPLKIPLYLFLSSFILYSRTTILAVLKHPFVLTLPPAISLHRSLKYPSSLSTKA